MSIVWGPQQADSTNAFRVGYEISQSPAAVSNGTSSVALTLKVWFGTKYYANNIGGLNWSGLSGWSRNSQSGMSFDHNSSTAWSTANQTLLATVTKSVSTSYVATVLTSFALSVNGVYAIAGTASVAGSITTQKRPPGAPSAPTGCTASRFSDVQTNLSWVNVSPTDPSKPYANIQVERSVNGGAWARIATLGVVTSYAATGQSTNARYQYRVRATSGSYVSAYSTSAYVYTTPSPPTGVAAVKSGTNIVVSWTDASPYNTSVEVWHAANGVWDVSVLATPGNVLSYTHSSPDPAKTHTYRVKSTIASLSLKSAYSTPSNVVQLQSPPAAPSNLDPTGVALDATLPITLKWKHNPLDTTAQTKYEVQWRPGARTNRLLNPSFEVNASNWFVEDGGTLTRDTAQHQFGAASGKFVTTESSAVFAQSTVLTAEGDTWAGSIYFKGTGSGQIAIKFLTPDGDQTSMEFGGVVAGSGAFQRLSLIASAPAGTGSVQLFFLQVDEGASTVYIDGALLERSPLLGDYVDGSTSPEWESFETTISSVSKVDVAANTWINGQIIEWQVRTYGSHVLAGPWSPSAFFTASSAPSVVISSPTLAGLGSSEILVSWNYFDAEFDPQISWTVTLWDDTGLALLETKSGNGRNASALLSTKAQDGETYTVRVVVSDSAGLASDPDQVTFSVLYLKPPVPVVSATWDAVSLSGIVTISNPDTGVGEADADHNDVYRQIEDGEWVLIAANVPLNGTVKDPIPSLSDGNTYRVFAVSTVPSTISGDSEPIANTDQSFLVVLNASVGFLETVRLSQELRMDESGGLVNQSLWNFAGKKKATEFSGEEEEHQFSLEAVIYGRTQDVFANTDIDDINRLSASWDDILAFSKLPAPICLRASWGVRAFVSSGNPAIGDRPRLKQKVNWNFVEIDFDEGDFA